MGVAWQDWLALLLFLTTWVGYTIFSYVTSRKRRSLSSILHIHRMNWMRRLLQRDVRVADASFIGNLERNVTFFASSCVLISAGLLTAVTVVDEIQMMLNRVSFIVHPKAADIELKLGVLIGIYIYAFFTFTWSMRQFGFASVVLGAAPIRDDSSVTPAQRRSFVKYAAKVIDLAGRSYNYGLRAFYFSLPVLMWFVGREYMVGATLVVVFILYYREFHSGSLRALAQIELVGETLLQNDDDRAG